jgi:hypothetical protein
VSYYFFVGFPGVFIQGIEVELSREGLNLGLGFDRHHLGLIGGRRNIFGRG